MCVPGGQEGSQAGHGRAQGPSAGVCVCMCWCRSVHVSVGECVCACIHVCTYVCICMREELCCRRLKTSGNQGGKEIEIRLWFGKVNSKS